MQITRNNHLRYMSKLTPFLVLLYLVQVFLYQKFAPAHLAGDINLVVGVGLAFIVLAYHFYDSHHKVIFRQNFLEIRFDLLKMKEEILYQNIVHVEIRKKKHHFAHIILHQRDGGTSHLYHVDSPELIVEFIEKKKYRKNTL